MELVQRDVARTVQTLGVVIGPRIPVIHVGRELVLCVFFRLVKGSERGEKVQAATACGGRRETRMLQGGDRNRPQSAA